jgi:protein phosphatase
MSDPGQAHGPVALAAGAWRAAGRTHVGHWRERNEDALVIDPLAGLCAVADGMGGAPAGDLASRLAIEALRTSLPTDAAERDLRAGFVAANRALLDAVAAQPSLAGMGTTLSAVLLRSDGVIWAHVGDSRIYRLTSGRCQQLSADETLGMELVRSGRFDEATARRRREWHVLRQVIGTEGGISPQSGRLTVAPGETVLLCSDGLSGMLTDDDIAKIPSDCLDDPSLACARLVGSALAAGGEDNITVVVAARV